MKDNISIFNKLNESFEGSFKSKQPKKINEDCNKNLKEDENTEIKENCEKADEKVVEKCDKPLKEGVNDDVNEAWNKLMDMGISEETLKIITSINGYNMETMKDVLYAAFGYRSFDQLKDEEEDINEACKMNESLRADTKEAIDLAINEIDNGNEDDPEWFEETYPTYEALVMGVYNDVLSNSASGGFGRDIVGEPKITSATKFSGKEEIIAEIKRQLAEWGYTEEDFANKE